MTGGARVVAITGASGYLGTRLCSRFQAHGWRVLRLVRSPRPGQAGDRRYHLTDQPDPGLLAGVDVLVHAAYDARLTRRDEIWRVNVDGSSRLLEAAERAGVDRVILISSLSAYAGTGQLYGQAKLAIEAAARVRGAAVVRPGLVYGERPGGMVGTLRRLTRLPLVPLVAGRSGLYPVHEDDLASTVMALATDPDLPTGPVGVAPPEPVPFRSILEGLAAAEGRRCRFVPLPWQFLYASLRLGELLHFPVPVRADSVLGWCIPRPRSRAPRRCRDLALSCERSRPEGRCRSASVVISTYSDERWPLLLRAVKSAREQDPAPCEIIVCVDHNPELSARCRREWDCGGGVEGPPVRVTDNRYSGHLAGARTTGAELAYGEYLLFLDDDAAATPGWLRQILAAFEDPSVHGVGGAPLPEYLGPRPRWFPPEFDWVFGCAYRGLPQVAAPMPRMIGATMAVRRADLLDLGGFHSDDHDDLELSHRLWARYPGGSVIYEPGAVVRHCVHKHRLTWAYFWRRCFTVNRSKVGALRRLGAAGNMAADRSFARRALTTGVTTGLRELAGGDVGGLQRVLAICAGLGLAGLGHLTGRLDLALGRDPQRGGR